VSEVRRHKFDKEFKLEAVRLVVEEGRCRRNCKEVEKPMKINTSIHNLNADNKLSKSGKILWILLNLINNKYFPSRARGLCIKDFCAEIDEKEFGQHHLNLSPCRALSYLFLLKVDWKLIKSELDTINVFDTGAGKGDAAIKLNDFAKGISTYYGIDSSSYKYWEKLCEYEFITLKQHNADNLLDIIPDKTNFFMSQSAIEHFENDLLYFKQIRNFIDKTNNNTIQVHMFPSAACLKLFPWHGIRQYTPRTISAIVQLFNTPNTYSILFRLGGRNCNDFHYKFITYPSFTKRSVRKHARAEEYRDLLKLTVKKDNEHRNHKPSFYALVIHSNFKKPIFRKMYGLTRRCS
jgi:hypothetical protein